MQPTVYQKPEIRDANDNIIQQGAFGKNTALANSTNDGWIDYVANDLEFLYDLAKDEVVPVPSLPASGQTNKTYLLTTTGVSYRWSGTQWVAVSSSEAVGRAESAANLAEQWATKTSGTVDGTEYSAKYYAQQAEASADDAQDVADDMATHLVQIDKNTGGLAKNSKRISNIEKLLQGNLYDYDTDDDVAYTKTVPSGALPYAGIETLGGKTLVWNQLMQNGNFESASGWSKGGGITSFSVADNVATMVIGTGEYNHYLRYATGKTLYSTHKYYVRGEMHSDDFSKAFIQLSGTSYAAVTVVASQTIPTNGVVSGIFTAAQDVEDSFLYYRFGDGSLAQEGSGTLQKCMLIDLTLMFGAGNEPSTVAEFEAMFPASYYPYNAGTLLSAGVTSVVSKDSNDVTLQTLPIPAEVQALEGYGWSAGSVYNYVDFERKVFVQNVGRVVVTEDTSIIRENSDVDNFSRYYFSYNQMKRLYFADTKTYRDLMVSDFGTVRNNFTSTGNDVGVTGYKSNTNVGKNWIYIFATQTTVEEFKTYLASHPITIYYELATPVETDISAYLTDNLIEVGAGGTLTFPNSNGADYHIPVPSDVTYMIDLQEAIENGN